MEIIVAIFVLVILGGNGRLTHVFCFHLEVLVEFIAKLQILLCLLSHFRS